jgi:hypothetical protein
VLSLISASFSGKGPRGRRYGLTVALGFWCNPMMKIIIFSLFPSSGAPVEWNWQGKAEVLGEKPVPVILCPPQIPRGLTLDRTRASAVGGRRLTAWTMARMISAFTKWMQPSWCVVPFNLRQETSSFRKAVFFSAYITKVQKVIDTVLYFYIPMSGPINLSIDVDLKGTYKNYW